jgi:hypothetical protein
MAFAAIGKLRTDFGSPDRAFDAADRPAVE